MSSLLYSDGYYADRHERTFAAAKRILATTQLIVPGPIRSAVDVGCGIGTWLAALLEYGCEDVIGYEGDWVPVEYLRIPANRLIRCDLSQRIRADRRFDLAISLECAEHLPPEAADRFVASLCGLSDFVLFSAAVPNQTGEGHINEQWPEYWVRLFEERSYVGLDWIRPQVWEDESISWWYRQNTVLFVRSERRSEMKPPPQNGDILPLVHPDLLKRWIEFDMARSQINAVSIKQALRQLRTAIIRRTTRKLRLKWLRN
jgi:SAM-dependent methyltransferase